MKFIQLSEDLKSGVKPIYLIEGEDAYFRTKAEEMIKAACLEMPELNFTTFDGTAIKGSAIADLTSALEAFPFMAPKRVIKVCEFYPTESDYKKYLEKFFESFPDTSVLLIVNSQGKKGVDLKRKKCITYVDCGKAERETVAKWVYLTMKRAGVPSTVEACEAVADYCLCDMARVSAETDKLIEWGRGASVTKADVDVLVYKDADYRVYQMTNAVARKDYAQFTEIMNDLLGKGFDENAVLGSLVNYFKTLLTVLVTDRSDAEIEKDMKMTDYVLSKNRQQARALGEQRLQNLITALHALTCSFRSGKITAKGALESAVACIFFGESDKN